MAKETLAHFQEGCQKKVAVVLSCPGKYEEKENKPAAETGTTGMNLETLLAILSNKLNRNDLGRSDITITNAWKKVEYVAKTGRSEATLNEVQEPRNIERLQKELEDITDFVIFCGENAKAASKCLMLKNKPKIIGVAHLGGRGLLSIKKGVDNNGIISAKTQIAQGKKASKRKLQAENTQKRLEVVARDIVCQLES